MNEDADRFDRELGALVRLHRKARGLSRKDLASQMGLTPEQIERYEAGSNRLSVMRYWTAMAILGEDPSRGLEQLRRKLSLEHMPQTESATSGASFISSDRGQQIVDNLAMCDRPELLDALADLIAAIGVHSQARASRATSKADFADLDEDAR